MLSTPSSLKMAVALRQPAFRTSLLTDGEANFVLLGFSRSHPPLSPTKPRGLFEPDGAAPLAASVAAMDQCADAESASNGCMG